MSTEASKCFYSLFFLFFLVLLLTNSKKKFIILSGWFACDLLYQVSKYKDKNIMMSVTPDQFKKVGMGLTPSPVPFLTPRPERRRQDLRGSEWNSNRLDKDKEVNVQVLLRCR